MRIPVTQDENDPLHQVIGRKPTQSLPWHINICRQRVRDDGTEHSALSPTGAASFHDVMKFAHFYDGRSHQFDAAEPDNDNVLTAYRAAAELVQQRKHAEAITAFTALADRKITDIQKSAALEQAAASARLLNDDDLASRLASRIPIDAVKKTVLMQTLLAQQKAPEVLAQFRREDIGAWPFWQRGAGYFARGRASAITKAGPEADADLTRALEFTGDSRLRPSIWLTMGNNREHTLNNDDGALAAYREVIGSAASVGGADGFTAVQGIARIQTRRGQYDEALATLRKVEIDNLRRFWRGSMLLAVGETLQSAGRLDEAITVFRSASRDETIEPRHQKAAGEALKRIESIEHDLRKEAPRCSGQHVSD
jgi:tetratricopeptide (TPR) repeat protein